MKISLKTIASLMVCAMLFASCGSSSSPSSVVLDSYKASVKAMAKMDKMSKEEESSGKKMSKEESEKALAECFKELASYYPYSTEKELEEQAVGLGIMFSLGSAFGKVDNPKDYKVIEEKIDGDKAAVKVKVTYESGKEVEKTENCVKTDKGWKLEPIKL